MCLGGSQPQAPNIVYRGPSEEDIAMNRASLETYQAQMRQQQTDFQNQLKAQIDKANKDTLDLQSKYEKEAASAAAAAIQQVPTYAVTATQTDAPQAATTTAATAKKKKPDSNLTISRAGLPAAPGTGLNIGV